MCETETDPVSNFDILYVAANLLHYPNTFMAQYLASVQEDLVRATKASVSHFNKHLVGLDDSCGLISCDPALRRASENFKGNTHFYEVRMIFEDGLKSLLWNKQSWDTTSINIW